MKRNVYIAYFLSFAFHSWFWLGNWIFYYLRFGDYATVAMLDSGAMMAGLLMEIPTGAIADIFGKKKTLMLAFLLQAIGNILMGTAGSLWVLAISLWLFICVGSAFYSGTLEALLYDSLKVEGDEDSFDKKIGNVRATRLWAMAVSGVIGGFSYYIFPGLPYILSGVLCLAGLIACFYLEEPVIDTEKYTWSSFFIQNTMGIRTLLKGSYMRKLTAYLVATGALAIVVYNLLDDLLAIEYGYSPLAISILFSVACLVAGFASMYIPRMKTKFDERFVLIVSMIIMAFVLILSPWIGMLISGGLLMVRVILEVIFDNAASVAVNRNTASGVRATTLSTLSLLQSVPYAIGGTFVGGLVIVLGGARNFSMWFGLVLMILTVVLGLRMEREKA